MCSAGDGGNGRFGAVQAGDLTWVSLDSLRLKHNKKYRCAGGGTKNRN